MEHGVFTPLVLSATGGMGREAAIFYKRLADGISRKEHKEYSVVMGWIRCRLSFAILRSAILCIRGSRSSRHRPVHELNITLAIINFLRLSLDFSFFFIVFFAISVYYFEHRFGKIFYALTAYALMVQISVCHAHVRIILKVNQQQDRNEKGAILSMEELTEERTVEGAIAARVRGRRTEARCQRERERHQQRRVADQVAFTKLKRGGRL